MTTRRTTPPTAAKRAPLTTATKTGASSSPTSPSSERIARGKAARREVPRSAHATLSLGPSRPDPVELLEGQATSRVPELVPIRYGRMLVSPFTFYRGAALLMAADLAGTPRSGLNVQLCGDAHLMNFGVFGSPERRLVFDINDFDETAPGPWEWDVKRLAASFAIAGRDNGFTDQGTSQGRCWRWSASTASAMRDVRRHDQPGRVVRAPRRRHGFAELQALASARRSASAPRRTWPRPAPATACRRSSKLTHVVDGAAPDHQRPAAHRAGIEELFADCRADDQVTTEIHETARAATAQTLQSDRRHLLEEFRLVDVARKVVGVGSVGTRAWIVLLLGRDDSDPLFLQAKEAQPSVLE